MYSNRTLSNWPRNEHGGFIFTDEDSVKRFALLAYKDSDALLQLGLELTRLIESYEDISEETYSHLDVKSNIAFMVQCHHTAMREIVKLIKHIAQENGIKYPLEIACPFCQHILFYHSEFGACPDP